MRLFNFLKKKYKNEVVARAPVRFYNTLSGKTETFAPLRAREVTMYTCGPTVYDRAHIGNMRAYLLSDLIRRTLARAGYHVSQVINITDVGHLTDDADSGEDKMEVGAKREGKTVHDIARRYEKLFLQDIETLHIQTEDTSFPRASEYIKEQIAMVETLLEKGFAYITSDAIYFDTTKFPTYGVLGNISLETLKEGARVENSKEKRHGTDFALWKFSGSEKRLQEWPSPWGVGFPGWHIECSAMIRALLGKEIDIHTGGIDHIPIHHNNEIAQSTCANNRPLARYWLHNAFLSIEGRKISKSLGNVVTLDDIANRGIDPLALRYLFLQAHYRTPLSFSIESLEGSAEALSRLSHAVAELYEEDVPTTVDPSYERALTASLHDDLNTPRALGTLWELIKDSSIEPGVKLATIFDADEILGLGLLDARLPEEEPIPAPIANLIASRERARKEKDFAEADRLRTQISVAGYTLLDTEKGPKVEKKSKISKVF